MELATIKNFPPNIILIEDDSVQCKMIERGLCATGATITPVISKVALSKVRYADCFVVDLDLGAGEVGAEWIITECQKRKQWKPQVVIYTGCSDELFVSIKNMFVQFGFKNVVIISKRVPNSLVLLCEAVSAKLADRKSNASILQPNFTKNGLPDNIKINDWSLYQPVLQPQVCAKSSHIISAEVLCRMVLASGEIVSPQYFLPTLKKQGLITKLTLVMIEKSIKEIYEHMNYPIDISFNIDYDCLQCEGFVNTLCQTIDSLDYPTSKITLELTENGYSRDLSIYKSLIYLRVKGYQISIDDFATGFACLSTLLEFPFNEIKIDRKHIVSLSTNKKIRAYLRAIEVFSSELGISVVVEGVETLAQREQVSDYNFDKIQGFFYGKPIFIPEFCRLLSKQNSEIC